MLAVAARVGAPLGHDFCAHLAVRQSEAVGADRAPARRRGAGRLRDRALQSDLARRGPWQLGRAFERLRAQSACDDAGDIRPRRRPGRRAHRESRRSATPIRQAPTWRPASSSARPRRASSSAAASSPLVYTPRVRSGVQPHDRASATASSTVSTACDAGKRGPAHQDHLDAERARRRDLAVGGVAAAVLGDDDLDRVRAQQSRGRRLR